MHFYRTPAQAGYYYLYASCKPSPCFCKMRERFEACVACTFVPSFPRFHVSFYRYNIAHIIMWSRPFVMALIFVPKNSPTRLFPFSLFNMNTYEKHHSRFFACICFLYIPLVWVVGTTVFGIGAVCAFRGPKKQDHLNQFCCFACLPASKVCKHKIKPSSKLFNS